MAGTTEGNPRAVAPVRPGSRYPRRVHIAFAFSLAVITVVCLVVGWNRRPQAQGFRDVPQNLQLLVSGREVKATETLTPTGADQAILRIDTAMTPELHDAGSQPAVEFDDAARTGHTFETLSNESWSLIVLHPGSAQPARCYSTGPRPTARSGRIRLRPIYGGGTGRPIAALVVPFHQGFDSTCFHFPVRAPVNLNGAYLTARFPPLVGQVPIVDNSRPVAGLQLPVDDAAPSVPPCVPPATSCYGFPEFFGSADELGTKAVTRTLALADGSTTPFSFNSDPHPQVTTATSWTWKDGADALILQPSAINATDVQQEANRVFLSGILLGIAGAALIALIQETVALITTRPSRKNGDPTAGETA